LRQYLLVTDLCEPVYRPVNRRFDVFRCIRDEQPPATARAAAVTARSGDG
jgi:hypothetical protein